MVAATNSFLWVRCRNYPWRFGNSKIIFIFASLMREDGKKRRVDFQRYLAPNLNLSKFKTKSEYWGFECCASSAMSMLLNISPIEIDKKCKDLKEGWHTEDVMKFLKKRGFQVIELSKPMVLNTWWQDYPLQPQHCLLINCCMDNEENSMVILHKGQIWHNFRKEENPALYFLNKPTQDVMLVYHPSWGKNN